MPTTRRKALDKPALGPSNDATALREPSEAPNSPDSATNGAGVKAKRAKSGRGLGSGGNQVGNRNALRHGLKGGQLPKDARYIELRLNTFRTRLEDIVLEQRGEVTLLDAAIIQTTLRWERHSALALRWLTKAGDKLDPVQRLTFSREIARASTERDKALAMLKLDAICNDPWLTLDQNQITNGKVCDDDTTP